MLSKFKTKPSASKLITALTDNSSLTDPQRIALFYIIRLTTDYTETVNTLTEHVFPTIAEDDSGFISEVVSSIKAKHSISLDTTATLTSSNLSRSYANAAFIPNTEHNDSLLILLTETFPKKLATDFMKIFEAAQTTINSLDYKSIDKFTINYFTDDQLSSDEAFQQLVTIDDSLTPTYIQSVDVIPELIAYYTKDSVYNTNQPSVTIPPFIIKEA